MEDSVDAFQTKDSVLDNGSERWSLKFCNSVTMPRAQRFFFMQAELVFLFVTAFKSKIKLGAQVFPRRCVSFMQCLSGLHLLTHLKAQLTTFTKNVNLSSNRPKAAH